MVRRRERDIILQSLRAGVVPATGLQHVQVGRARQVEALLADLARISEGGVAFRLIVGEYGAGKTFLQQFTRTVADQQRMVTVRADVAPERRLQGSSGYDAAMYRELIANLATLAKPDGGAVEALSNGSSSASTRTQEYPMPIALTCCAERHPRMR